ncbi:MAG: cell division protein ZapA [Thermodesulfobacteriota bacterium]
MPEYKLTVLGQEVAFKTDADSERVQEAMDLLENRYQELEARGLRLGKQKLLVFLALGLADDYLQMTERLQEQDVELQRLLDKIDGSENR